MLRILLVSDDPDQERRLAVALTSGAVAPTLRRVETAAAFRVAMVELRPDAVLSNLRLRAFDGLMALRMASGAWPEVPFIFLYSGEGPPPAIRDSALPSAPDDQPERLLETLRSARAAARVEAVRRADDPRLRESEGRLRRFMEITDLVFWLTDPKVNQVLYVSPAYERL